MSTNKSLNPLVAALSSVWNQRPMHSAAVGALLVAAPFSMALAAGQDTGDAPAGYGIAIHEIVDNAPFIGEVAPDIGAGTTGPLADGDDQVANGDIDDEEGVSAFPTLVQNQKAFTTNVFSSNPTGAPANLVGWVDFNGDGSFSASEAATGIVPAGADNEKVKLIWSNLKGITTDYTGTTYARFRITSGAITPQSATELLADGEVEDYVLQIQVDTDGDEIPDAEDNDNDNDGIPNETDGVGVDSDSDGIENFRDTDSDDDGIPDFIEAGSDPTVPADSDSDGTPDYLDLDSDNDGTPDADRVTGDDDNDGIIGSDEGLGDTDGDGVLNTSDLDTDNDTIPDSVETTADSDGDGVPNFLDLDSDNDGLPDIRESGYLAVGAYPDTDGDHRVDANLATGANGLLDSAETSPDSGVLVYTIVDSDNDGLRDSIDINSDGDAEPDLTEAGGNDQDKDGKVDSLADTNGNGVIDSVDQTLVGGPDADGDSIVDTADIDFLIDGDNDDDGIADSFDPDADGNGMVDDGVITIGANGNLPDLDGDGLSSPDYLDPSNAVDNSTGENGPTQNPGATPDAAIETGLEGIAGCSIVGKGAPVDPTLPLLAVLAGIWLTFRRRFGLK